MKSLVNEALTTSRNDNCDTNGEFFHAEAPGVADLSVTPVNGPDGTTKNFEDKITSFRCSSK